MGIGRLLVVIWCVCLVIGNICAFFETTASSNVIEIKRINSPLFDGNVGAPEWVNAALLDFNFTFANGQSYKANVHLGHNSTHFFVGAILFDVGPNPSTVPDYVTRPDGFYIYFDIDNDGNLTSPEDAKGLLNFIGIYHGEVFWSQSISEDGFWESAEYSPSLQFRHEARPEVEGKILWTSDVNAGIAYGKAYDISTHGSGSYSASFGDQHFEFCFSLNSNDTFADGLHLKTSEAKTLGFVLEFYRQGYELENGTIVPDLYDFWPGEGFTPNVFINASEYAKMLIDLSLPTNDLLNSRILFITITVIVLAITLAVLCVKFKRR